MNNKTKKTSRILIFGSLTIVIFISGFVAGDYLSEYDVLCEKNFSPHKLQREFKSKDGIIIPVGTIVYVRGCKPNTDVLLNFYVDNWNYKHMEELKTGPNPAYHLDVK